VVGHFDTVWPAGTVSARPFTVHDGKASGPGTFDMKAGVVIAEFALRGLLESGRRLPRPVVVFLASDEELGSPASRDVLLSHCQRAAYALVLEPPLPDGTIKTARKGAGRFTLEVEGRAAHAGIEPEKGVSAVKELAHQVLRLEELNDFARGTSVNVGLIRGGSGPNVIPAHAEAEVNFRAWTAAEMERIEAVLSGLTAVTPGARLLIRKGVLRPPMERTAGSAALFDRAREIAAGIDMRLRDSSSGGASDGNLCSAAGLPTLDGLGALGDGAHADHEYVVLDSLPERALLLAALLLKL
jgi:glutamate carboxypeptidase